VAYDEELAARVRDALVERTDFTEKAMFGGLAFMVNTHMACGSMGDDLMVRVGKDNHDHAISRGAHEMEFTGRPMRGLVVVPGSMLVTEQDLAEWVAEAVAFASSQPPKPPKPARRPRGTTSS